MTNSAAEASSSAIAVRLTVKTYPNKSFAQQFNKDPAVVEVVLQQSKRIVRMGDGKLITESLHGFVCANSGVDRSNVPGDRNVAFSVLNGRDLLAKVQRFCLREH